MGKIKTFQDIQAWQKAYKLVLFIYKITATFPISERYGLVLQIRRAALSIISNIAEGFKRKSKIDRLHFYNMAESSLEELKCQLLLSKDLGYISQDIYKKGLEMAEEVGKTLYGWIQSQK